MNASTRVSSKRLVLTVPDRGGHDCDSRDAGYVAENAVRALEAFDPSGKDNLVLAGVRVVREWGSPCGIPGSVGNYSSKIQLVEERRAYSRLERSELKSALLEGPLNSGKIKIVIDL